MPKFNARYEFKYLIDEEQADWIRQLVRCFADPDPYGNDGVYDVISLYFDTWDWSLALQTVEGQRNRYKLRIRTYGFSDDDPVFVEIKGRVGTSICKQRALIHRRDAETLCAGNPFAGGRLVAAKKSHQDDLDAFCNIVDSLDCRPRLWVKYQREAYGSAFGDGARLTFDRLLHVQSPLPEHLYLPDPTAFTRVPLNGKQTILEMKFNGASPFWMQRIVHTLELQRTACSKYVQGVEHFGDAPWNRIERAEPWTVY